MADPESYDHPNKQCEISLYLKIQNLSYLNLNYTATSTIIATTTTTIIITTYHY